MSMTTQIFIRLVVFSIRRRYIEDQMYELKHLYGKLNTDKNIFTKQLNKT